MRTALFLLAASLVTGCVTSTSDGDLEVRNHSDFTIEELYVTNVGSATWGSNLLGGDVLYPGETIAIGVDCGHYDALLVDETNTQCEVHDIDLCFDDATWVINNNTCSVFAARAAEKAAAAAKQTSTQGSDARQ